MVRGKLDARTKVVKRGLQELQSMIQQMEDRLLQTIRELPSHQNANGRDSNGKHGEGDGGGSNTQGSVGESHRTNMTRGEDWFRKIELPIFAGEDAQGWIRKIERYFRFRGLSEEDKAVLVAVEGKALCWMQWWEYCT